VRVGDVSPNISIVPFNNDIATLERAVKERVFFVKNINKDSPEKFVSPPTPAPGLFSERLSETLGVLRPFLPSTAPITHQQFVDACPSRKRKCYENALADIRLSGLDYEKDSSVSVFVKYEKTDRTTKEDPVPRVISPRDPKFNIQLGRYLKPIEERIFKALGKMFGHPTVMKGMDTDKTAAIIQEKWDMFNKPVAIGLDASRFDQHVSLEALKFEHSVYELCFPRIRDRKKLRNILKYQLHNKCSGYTPDGSISYVKEGTRMSGDMNTSLGNCILMCMMIHAYSLHCRVPVQLANNGDDCVVFMEQRDLPAFSDGLFQWFWEMGFNMAIEPPSYELEHIEFCQCRPVYDGEKYTMCRNPTTAIAKDSVYLKHPDQFVTYPAWLHAVGTGGIALAGGMPIFNSFYKCYQRSGEPTWYCRWKKRWRAKGLADDVLPWFMREMGLRGRRVAREPTPESRASFYLAWGITPDEQLELEKYYDRLSLSTGVLDTSGASFQPRGVFPEVGDV
jgi:hypothetical protein